MEIFPLVALPKDDEILDNKYACQVVNMQHAAKQRVNSEIHPAPLQNSCRRSLFPVVTSVEGNGDVYSSVVGSIERDVYRSVVRSVERDIYSSVAGSIESDGDVYSSVSKESNDHNLVERRISYKALSSKEIQHATPELQTSSRREEPYNNMIYETSQVRTEQMINDIKTESRNNRNVEISQWPFLNLKDNIGKERRIEPLSFGKTDKKDTVHTTWSAVHNKDVVTDREVEEYLKTVCHLFYILLLKSYIMQKHALNNITELAEQYLNHFLYV